MPAPYDRGQDTRKEDHPCAPRTPRRPLRLRPLHHRLRLLAGAGSASSARTVELEGSEATIRRPNLVGALLGKVAAVTRIRSQTAAERAKHVRDADALARLLGAEDRRLAALTKADRKLLERYVDEIDFSALADAQLRLLLAPSKD